MLKTSIFIWPYLALVIVGLTLPSDGNHSFASPKTLTFLTSLFSLGIYFFCKQRMTWHQLKLVGFTLCSFCFLLLWLFIGLLNPLTEGNPIDQFKLFVVTLLFVVMTLYVVNEKLITPEQLLRFMINANFTYSVIKIVLIGLSLLNVMDVFSFLNTLGVRVMSMAVVTGFSRLQTSVDIITPFLLFFILQSPRLNLGYNKKIRLLFCIISVISTILSFSRFLMMVSAASCFLYWMTLKLPRMIKALLFCSCCLFVGVGFIGIDKVEKMIELRFFSQDNFQSDQTRVEQIEALMVEYDQAPFFGAGLGGYAKDHIRDSDLKHSYEVQWVAFLMQLGLIGLCFLMIPLGIISRGLLHFPFSRLKFAFLSLFLLWLLSGFTNPFLISLTSGIVYSLFFLGADIMKSPAEHATN